MDAPTLQHLEALALAAHIGNPGTDTPTMLVPDSYSLQSLEQHMAAPSRFRGEFSTRSIIDYSNYINSQNVARVFVDPDAMDALAFFDLGEEERPGHGEHRARLSLNATPAFRAATRADGKEFSQKELAHFMEDWHAHASGESTAGKALAASQVASMVRRIEVKATSERSHEDGDWNARRTGMDAIDASAGSDTPALIRFTCVPYEGLQQRTITLRLSILTGNDKPTIKLRAVGMESLQEEIATEFVGVLSCELDDHATLLMGKFVKS